MNATMEFTLTREEENKVTVKNDLSKREASFELDPSTKSKMYEIQKAIEDQGHLDAEFVKEFGIKLFEMLLSDSKDVLHTYLDQSDHLTIVINVRDPSLSEIPWELCYDPEYPIYLGADSQCSLVRRDQKSTAKPGPIDFPLKVLVIVSSPMDLEEKEYQPDPDEIVKLMNPVKDLVDRGMVRLDFLERASVKHIQDKLMEGYHIVHFIGHGFYDSETGKGYLVIEDKERNAKNLEEQGVAQLFGVNPPQLVILTACESSPLIPLLLSRKIPAVLAMQYATLKGVAYQFVDRFYSSLVRGNSLVEAVSDARSAVQLEEGTGCTGWFAPVLYTRADNILEINTGSPVIPPEKKVERHDAVTDLLGVENFVGRRKELWLIEKALLEDNLKVVVITGIGGIGKTALASKVVGRHKDKFRGVFSRKIVDPEMKVEELIGFIDQFLTDNDERRLHDVMREADLDTKFHRLNDCLKERYLFVLDNLDAVLKDGKIVDTGMETFLQAFLSGDHSSKLIVTSRYQFTFRDERAISLIKYLDLNELSLQAVLHLLEKLEIRDYGIGKRIYEKIGGNPQFLEFFVNLARKRSVEGLLENVTPVREKIGEWLLHESVGLLTEEERKVLKKMSAFRLKVDRSVFDVVGASVETADELVHHSLVSCDEHGLYSMPQGIRQYVYGLLSESERKEAHEGAVKYYEALFLREHERALLSGKKVEKPGEYGLLDISEFHYHLMGSEQYVRAGELVIDSVDLFLRRGYWGKLLELLVKTVNTTEGTLKAAGLHGLGIVVQSLGEYEKAEKLYKESLEIAEKLHDEQGRAASLYHVGILYQLRGEYKEAEKLYKESLEIAEKLHDEQGRAASLYQLGIIHEEWGEYKEAEKLYKESLEIAEKLHDKRGIAQSLHQLGILHQLRGEFEVAEKLYKESLDIAEKFQDRQGIAQSFHQLGTIHQLRGEFEVAEKLYRESLDIKKSLQDRQGIAQSLLQLGTIHEEWGEYKEAEKLYRESLEIREKLQDKQGIAASFHQLGILHQLQGEYKEAEKLYKESLDIKEKFHDKRGIAASLHQLGTIHQSRGEYKEAEKLYKESLDIKKSLHDRQGIARSFNQLGAIYEELGEYEEAMENYIHALKIFLRLGSPEAEDVVKSLQGMRQTDEEQFDKYWKVIPKKTGRRKHAQNQRQ